MAANDPVCVCKSCRHARMGRKKNPIKCSNCGLYSWDAVCPKCLTHIPENGSTASEPIRTSPVADTASILHDAEKATVHTRREEYGHPFDNFSQIAAEWSLELGIPVTPEQVGRMMVRLKLVRLRHNPNHRDSVVDIAGYANCLDMIRQRREQGATEPVATKVTTYPPEDVR